MATFQPPTDKELQQQALKFLRAQPKRYRELRRDGELEEIINIKVEETKRHAAALIKNGVLWGARSSRQSRTCSRIGPLWRLTGGRLRSPLSSSTAWTGCRPSCESWSGVYRDSPPRTWLWQPTKSRQKAFPGKRFERTAPTNATTPTGAPAAGPG